MRVPLQHALADVPGQRSYRSLAHTRILRQTGHEGVPEVMPAVADARSGTSVVPSRLPGAHPAGVIHMAYRRLAFVSGYADFDGTGTRNIASKKA